MRECAEHTETRPARSNRSATRVLFWLGPIVVVLALAGVLATRRIWGPALAWDLEPITITLHDTSFALRGRWIPMKFQNGLYAFHALVPRGLLGHGSQGIVLVAKTYLERSPTVEEIVDKKGTMPSGTRLTIDKVDYYKGVPVVVDGHAGLELFGSDNGVEWIRVDFPKEKVVLMFGARRGVDTTWFGSEVAKSLPGLKNVQAR